VLASDQRPPDEDNEDDEAGMVTICAWCQKYLGTKEPLADPSLTHGICKTCAMRQQLGGSPTLVVSRERAEALPFLMGLLHGTPEIRVIVDRRQGERRRSALALQVREDSLEAERRRLSERRHSLGLVLV
jgi:hypothetical protein